ncbi:DUF6265 family protein [Ascidiimonas sp. W6]|uniref:DUF6265 family protein n=1 Tax=Ascidiimonas meishanensis TaxID=3128903 RepID=UPI0030EF5C5C
MKKSIFLLLIFMSAFVFSQREKTITLTQDTAIEQIALNELSWIQGHWRGEAFGGIAEEIWSAPEAGSMMFVFRHIIDNKVNFYEVGAIMEMPEGLVLKLKHFHSNLKGWETKDETVDFKFIKKEGSIVYFDNFTFEKVSDTEMNIYVMISEDGEHESEVKFNYKKQ